MASSPDSVSMALFCDFENVALGVRDAQYDKFDIKRVLERLLLKGSIVVKKAYCDWDRYKGFKATMHEANFELIEIPHVRQSGKNSADIRLVVDALDLCYTKSHVNTFVIISGDSDFSPLVSKLRENAKYVIGVGVKQSTSDLLIANCDEFIFYDDLVREGQRDAARREQRNGQTQARRSPEDERRHREDKEKRKQQAIDLAVETFDALVSERSDGGKIWASVLKDAIKRRKPDFNESYYGFRAFLNLIEEAQARGLLEIGRDEKSGAFVYRGNSPVARTEDDGEFADTQASAEAVAEPRTTDPRTAGRGSGRGRRGRSGRTEGDYPRASDALPSLQDIQASMLPSDAASLMETDPWAAADAADRMPDPSPVADASPAEEVPRSPEAAEAPADADATKKKPARKPSARKAAPQARKAPARPRKKKEATPDDGE
jgi:uncharacterized LabA/DUF88 family protein